MKKLLLFVFALVSLAQRARAQDTLEIPESCGSQSELTREVAALRGSARSSLESERSAVHLTREGEGYLLTVELPDGRRSLRDPDCRALFRAAIVIAALGQESSVENVLEASARTRDEERSEGQAAAPVEPSAEPAMVEAPRRSTAESSRETPRAGADAARKPWLWSDPAHYPRELALRVLLRAELGYGVLPDLSGIFGAGVALEYTRFAARATLAYQGPARSVRSDGEGVNVQGLSASLTAELVTLPWLRLGIGIDYHALHGRGLGGRSQRSAWATQPTLHAGAAVRLFSRGPFWLELSARALWAPKPARFTMTPDTRVYRTSPWGLAGGISAGFQFL